MDMHPVHLFKKNHIRESIITSTRHLIDHPSLEKHYLREIGAVVSK